MTVKFVDAKDAKLEIAKKDLTVMNFFATWCGPCQMFMPVLESLAKDHRVFKVDFDKNREFATELEVHAVPTTFFYKGGKLVDRVTGYMPVEVLQKKVASFK